MKRHFVLAAMAATLIACSPKPSDPVPPTAPAARAPTVIDPQLKALEDAKKVQSTLDEADRKSRQAIEDAGG